MATTVRRRVTYIKLKKGQVKRKRPSVDVHTGRKDDTTSSDATLDGNLVVNVRVRQPAKPWWKMAWIPLLALIAVGVFFSLAMGVGDNLRGKLNETDLSSGEEDDGPRTTVARKKVAYPETERETGSGVDGRRKPTNSSFLATHYNKSPGGPAGGAGSGGAAGGGGGNGGAPQSNQGSQGATNKAPSKSGGPGANCVLSYGGNAAELSQRLGDCLGKQ